MEQVGKKRSCKGRTRRKDSDSFTYTVQNVFFVFLFVLCSLSTSQTEPKRGDQGILLGSPVPPTPPSHPGRPAQGPNPVRWLSQSADKRERKNLVMPRRLTVSQVSSVVSGHSHWWSSAALRRVQLQWITADRDRLKLLGAWLHKKRCSKKKERFCEVNREDREMHFFSLPFSFYVGQWLPIFELITLQIINYVNSYIFNKREKKFELLIGGTLERTRQQSISLRLISIPSTFHTIYLAIWRRIPIH